MNKCSFVGRMGKDPKFFPGQGQGQGAKKAFMTFSLAVKRPGGQKDAQGNVITDWHDFVAFGKTAELLNQYCPTGTLTAITDCTATKESYTDKNQQPRTSTKFMVSEIDLEVSFAANKANGTNTGGGGQSQPQANGNGGGYDQGYNNNGGGNQFSQGRQNQQPQAPVQQQYVPGSDNDLPF